MSRIEFFMPRNHINCKVNVLIISVNNYSRYCNRHFLPFGRADLSTSTSLCPIAVVTLQLMNHFLVAALISTRE